MHLTQHAAQAATLRSSASGEWASACWEGEHRQLLEAGVRMRRAGATHDDQRGVW